MSKKGYKTKMYKSLLKQIMS